MTYLWKGDRCPVSVQIHNKAAGRISATTTTWCRSVATLLSLSARVRLPRIGQRPSSQAVRCALSFHAQGRIPVNMTTKDRKERYSLAFQESGKLQYTSAACQRRRTASANITGIFMPQSWWRGAWRFWGYCRPGTIQRTLVSSSASLETKIG